MQDDSGYLIREATPVLNDYGCAPLRLAIIPGAYVSPLDALLAAQRGEEPETPVRVVETARQELAKGLIEGRYELGLSGSPISERFLCSNPLWREELAFAVPLRSPLLAFAEIRVEDAVQYPLILWRLERDEAMNQQIDALLQSAGIAAQVMEQVQSSELMMALIGGGYGIGISTKSRIISSRRIGVIMRPLAGNPRFVTTYLTHHQMSSTAVDRFIQRAHVTSKQAKV